jgi:tetratricopeptide (TPR) repeat protein
MSEGAVKEDPVKLHKEANTLYDQGKYKEAMDKSLRAAELYQKGNNFFDATSMLYKAGECAFMLKDYKKAVELFMKSAELSFSKAFDRFAVSALEYARDGERMLKNNEQVKELEKKIKEIKKRLETSF